jgi:hypothetical protein
MPSSPPRAFDRSELAAFYARLTAQIEATDHQEGAIDLRKVKTMKWASTDPFGARLRVNEFDDIYAAALKYAESLPPPKPPDYSEIPMNTFPFFRSVLVKGQHFLDPAGKAAVGKIAPGDELQLSHEPTNQHDPYAVGAFVGGVRVGYVQKEVSAALAWLLAIKMPLHTTVVEIGKAGNLVVNITEKK